MPKVAAIQLKSDGDLDTNLARAGAVIAAAATAGAELLVLPENFAYYGAADATAVARDEHSVDSPARRFLAEQARRFGVWIVGGTLPLFAGADDSKPYSTCLLLDPQGREVARYQKIHLFDVTVAETGKRYCESDGYQHGSEPVVAATPLGNLGLSVCYDLRFPELYRALAGRGADILVAPSAFTATTGKAHWRLLLQARAVENLCYVIGANLGNRDHPTKPTWGGSVIIDPWGDVIAEMADEEGFIVADLDLQRVLDLRRNMPVLNHRRL
ncbi:MAG: carbon-nitrogen hydrolase family protein [Porticoccaceae bacterium]